MRHADWKEAEFFDELPAHLRGEVAVYLMEEVFEQSDFFRYCSSPQCFASCPEHLGLARTSLRELDRLIHNRNVWVLCQWPSHCRVLCLLLHVCVTPNRFAECHVSCLMCVLCSRSVLSVMSAVLCMCYQVPCSRSVLSNRGVVMVSGLASSSPECKCHNPNMIAVADL